MWRVVGTNFWDIRHRAMVRWARIGSLLIPLLLASCSDTGLPTGEENGGTDEVIAGVNLTTLFAPPTPREGVAVEADWAQRNPVAEDEGAMDEIRAWYNHQPLHSEIRYVTPVAMYLGDNERILEERRAKLAGARSPPKGRRRGAPAKTEV